MAPPPPELMEEIVEEILLRFPPDDPASLARAAIVCKLWCRLVCGAAFRRRFREFHFHHRAAPLLGVLYHDSCKIPLRFILRVPTVAYFIPTTSFRPAHDAASRHGWGAIDARHGRVLLYWTAGRLPDCRGFSVWDPITDEQRDLPKPPPLFMDSWTTAAVACAATASGNCDHLDCSQGPFLVILLDIDYDRLDLSVYSSEEGAWRKLIVCDGPKTNSLSRFNNMPGVLVRSALYFLVHLNFKIVNHAIVKYNLATQQLSTIRLPSKFRCLKRSIVLITDDDGGLGFVSSVKYKLNLWSIVAGPDGDVDFVLSRVIDLQKVLPSSALIKNLLPQVNGFVGGGASRVLFMRTSDGLYSIEINSSQVKKVDICCGNGNIIPYISFCTPNSRVQH